MSHYSEQQSTKCSYQAIPEIELQFHKPEKKPCDLSDIAFLAPFIVFSVIAISTVFYKIHEHWDIYTCFWYSCQALIGAVYNIPEGKDSITKSFTLFLYFLGGSFVYAAIAAYANSIVERAVSSAKDIVRLELDQDGDGIITRRERIHYYCNECLLALNWNERKYTYITFGALLSWVGVGVAYGRFYEGYDAFTAVFFSLDAIMLQANMSPPCADIEDDTGTCNLGTARALFMSTYLLIGSPLFLLTMGQFYEVLIHSAQLAKHRQIYMRKFSPAEFQFAKNALRSDADCLTADDQSVNLAEFMLLELVRTEAVDHNELEYMRELFEKIDADKSGRIDYEEISIMNDN